MIVRIMGEDQYRVADDVRDRLNEFDNAAVAAAEAGDEAAFQAAFDQLLALVREHGEALGEDDLSGSDVILPPADSTIEEAAGEFTGEGLIPD